MKMFDTVNIACDQGALDVGMAVRAALELFRLRAHLHFCVQKRNVLDFLAGHIPESEYVVLCCHGLGSANDEKEIPREMKMGFNVVHQIGREWQKFEFALTPLNIPKLIKLPGRKVIALGCGCGREPLARAFLRSGCKAYIGATRPVDQDSTALFAIAFFYHLLRPECDPAIRCSDKEAFERAAAVDALSREGTHVFRYYDRLPKERSPS